MKVCLFSGRVVGVALVLGFVGAGKAMDGLPGELPPALEQQVTVGVQLKELSREGLKFDSASAMTPVPGSPGWSVIAMQRGELWCVNFERGEKRVFLDFRQQMAGAILFEEGVHGLAFHPQFGMNGLFYLSYSQLEPRRSRLVEMRVKPGFRKDEPVEGDATTERVLLELPQPLAEHWGGGMTFGPDGFLYYALGDGGVRNDPYRLAQSPWSYHGKVLRLDVNGRSGARAYALPKDNPFINEQMWLPEIWALGLRNPWGLAFDPVTRELWCADVGQDFWEEINVLKAGGNYGWSDRDGYWPLPAHVGAKPYVEPAPKFIEPVHAYSRLRAEGLCIIGGFVYRGAKLPQLSGQYVFGDWAMGRIWSLEVKREGAEVVAVRRHLLYERGEGENLNPTVIAADAAGEVLVLTQSGEVYELAETPPLAPGA